MKDIHLSAKEIPCYDCLEVSFTLPGKYVNPFDPREIQVDGIFASPAGKEMRMPGFVYQPCQRSHSEDGTEIIEITGDPCWMIRFAPATPGEWQVIVRVKDASGERLSLPQKFNTLPAELKGYIRRAGGSDYFCYENGQPFFPLGENIAWASKRGTYDFDDWLPAAQAAGMNLVRFWLQWVDHRFSLENPSYPAGQYDLANAWKVDYVLKKSRECGLRVLFTLDTPELYTPENYWLGKVYNRSWDTWPYHTRAGGPLATPTELFTHAEGRRLIRQRLRYIVARWGWDDNIFCWQLWNELNLYPDWPSVASQIGDWHNEMAAYLREIDLNQHLVSTSFYNVDGIPEVWRAQELDFVQPHVYGPVDMAKDMPEAIGFVKKTYGWPVLIDEFGPPLTAECLNLSEIDPTGVHLHNAIWSTALGGGAGAALTWWWDSYIHPQNLYRVFTPLVKFTRDVPWNTAGFQLLRANLSWISSSNPEPPALRAIGLVGSRLALVWVQNTGHTFETVSAKKEAPTVQGARIDLENIPATACQVEWWDTETGEILQCENVSITPGGVSLDLPPLKTDIALKIRYG